MVILNQQVTQEEEKTVCLNREKTIRTVKVKGLLVVYFVNLNTGVIRVSQWVSAALKEDLLY